ncbi:hypothetical protein [Kineobactrum sediminis]|uniref:hypothetical protein n=1 Tax=Kineobactrum sediminis TaxID=1905677 RepID=UPI00158AE942|nr:hypothetical protein [Kineobactrum sediminis]
MNEVFVIRNQQGHYWGKSKAWVDGRDPRMVQRVRHHDEGVNLLFELSSKNIDLRGEVLAAEVNARGEPVLEISTTPLPVAPDDHQAALLPTSADTPEVPSGSKPADISPIRENNTSDA